MKCKTGNWECVYHACMSDDCQKAEVLSSGDSWGLGKCEKDDMISLDPDDQVEILVCEECGSEFPSSDLRPGSSYELCSSCFYEYCSDSDNET